MSSLNPIVIIGAGIGGISAAAALRDNGYEGRIVLVNREKEFPYDRPPLSKSVLQGEQTIADVYLKSPAWYRENNIEILNGIAATGLTPESHQVALGNGEVLEYHKLLLATGADARHMPPLEHDSIPHFYLRTDEDAKGLKDFMQPGKKLLLVGAGVIGMEVAASAIKSGCDVTVLEIVDRVMARSMPPVMSEWLQKKHESRGVKFHIPDAIDKFDTREGVTGVVLKSGGFVPADVMLICVGVSPSTQLAEEAGIRCENGVVVNAFGETSAPDIYAIGDVANYPDAWSGGNQRAENWMHAQKQAECVARNMNGAQDTYSEIQSVWSDQYEYKLQIAGILEGEQQVVRGNMDSDQFMIFWLNGNVVAGVLAVNQAKNMRLSQNLIKGKTPVNIELLADPDANLKKVGR